MPAFVRLETGKLATAHYHKRHVKSDCWSCGAVSDLAFFIGTAWEFLCPDCEVTWRELRPLHGVVSRAV